MALLLLTLAILPIAIGIDGRLSLGAVLLIGLSIAANAWGAYRFLVEPIPPSNSGIFA